MRGPLREIVLSPYAPGVRRINPRAIPTSLTVKQLGEVQIIPVHPSETNIIALTRSYSTDLLTCDSISLGVRRERPVKDAVFSH